MLITANFLHAQSLQPVGGGTNGSVNAMHDSLNPLTGLLPMTGMWLNVVFGGVGNLWGTLIGGLSLTAALLPLLTGWRSEYVEEIRDRGYDTLLGD